MKLEVTGPTDVRGTCLHFHISVEDSTYQFVSDDKNFGDHENCEQFIIPKMYRSLDSLEDAVDFIMHNISPTYR